MSETPADKPKTFFMDDKEIEKEFPGFTTVLAQFEPGDAILFDQLCVHRSGHAAAVGPLLPGQDSQEGGFSGTIAPDQAGVFAFAQGQRRAVEHDLFIVAHHEVGGGQKGRGVVSHSGD